MRYNYDLDDTSVNPRKIITGILITLIEIAIVVLVAFLIVRYGLERMTMSGNGMEPTVKDDDSILINKMSYKLHSVKRNDVVVLRRMEVSIIIMWCRGLSVCRGKRSR